MHAQQEMCSVFWNLPSPARAHVETPKSPKGRPVKESSHLAGKRTLSSHIVPTHSPIPLQPSENYSIYMNYDLNTNLGKIAGNINSFDLIRLQITFICLI